MSNGSSQSVCAESLTLQLLDELLSSAAAYEIGVRLWDSTLWPDDLL